MGLVREILGVGQVLSKPWNCMQLDGVLGDRRGLLTNSWVVIPVV